MRTGQRIPVPATPGMVTEPGLVIYRFGADLFYANDHRFTDDVRALIAHAPTPVRWFIVDAEAITDLDYSAARSIRELLDDLAQRKVGVIFARVSPYLRSDMDRHGVTAALGETRSCSRPCTKRSPPRAAACPRPMRSDERARKRSPRRTVTAHRRHGGTIAVLTHR